MKYVTRFAASTAAILSFLVFGGYALGGAAISNTAAEYSASQEKMSSSLKAAGGETADSMFANKMFVHHQGAIDMANIELKYGRDAELRTMAQKLIEESRTEQADLKNWTGKRGH